MAGRLSAGQLSLSILPPVRGPSPPASSFNPQCKTVPLHDLSYLREFEHITLARVLLARYQAERAEASIHQATRLLERLLSAAEEGARTGSVIEILVLRGTRAPDAWGHPGCACLRPAPTPMNGVTPRPGSCADPCRAPAEDVSFP